MTSFPSLYTFVAECDGTTSLEQVEAATLVDAVRHWNSRDGTERIPVDRLDLHEPTPITGLKRVWCISGISHLDKLYIVHIIETTIDHPTAQAP
jgi:hypothetical protein